MAHVPAVTLHFVSSSHKTLTSKPHFDLGHSQKSQCAKSGEYSGCSMGAVCFSTKSQSCDLGHCCGAGSIHYASLMVVFFCQNFLCLYVWDANFICNLLMFSTSWHLPASLLFTLFQCLEVESLQMRGSSTGGFAHFWSRCTSQIQQFFKRIISRTFCGACYICAALCPSLHTNLFLVLCWNWGILLDRLDALSLRQLWHTSNSFRHVATFLPCICTRATNSSAISQPSLHFWGFLILPSMCPNIVWGTAPCSPNLSPSYFCLWGKLIILMYSAPVGYEETLQPQVHNCPGDLWKGATVHDQLCLWVHWFMWMKFWVFVVSCNLLDNKNWTVIKLGMCIMSVKVKYYTFKVFVHHHHYYISFMEMGHLLTCSGLTYPKSLQTSTMIPSASLTVVFHYPG